MAADEFSERMIEAYDAIVLDPRNTGYSCDIFRKHVRFGSATSGPPARVTFIATVAPEMCNGLGNLHGGCATTLIDVTSSALLFALGGHFSAGGVSRSLNITFLRPAPEGTEISINCELVHSGKRLALLRADIRRTDTGDLCVLGEHDKASTPIDAQMKL
ncbi:thioesterase [Nannizzia gypsea CBS 118893]|uniref:Thioesterase n=1 Tax=Arthroderma gypseum (strain ATCC MYA-4604 / CBS 118893) TaxID=535722 RepID=E4UQE8_ARTGP|nr:thioesterase [Nannizzia gypsea CBS 118893]EFR00018.1 thioesterase [Nannizzia gypsea CBS 118893]